MAADCGGQVYCAIIAALLIDLWTGSKPNKRTYEMLSHDFSGWATTEELESPRNKTPSPTSETSP